MPSWQREKSVFLSIWNPFPRDLVFIAWGVEQWVCKSNDRDWKVLTFRICFSHLPEACGRKRNSQIFSVSYTLYSCDGQYGTLKNIKLVEWYLNTGRLIQSSNANIVLHSGPFVLFTFIRSGRFAMIKCWIFSFLSLLTSNEHFFKVVI